MKALRGVAAAVVLFVAFAAAGADFLAPAGYEQQFREQADSPPATGHPLGTDELGRDRLARLLYGLRNSMLLAPATACLALAIASVLGLAAGYLGGKVDSAVLACTDLMGSVPLLFLLIGLRALLPLDLDAWVSVCVTFLLLGVCGWASGVRVIRSAVMGVRASDYMRQAEALGVSPSRLLAVHAAAAVRPVLLTQFWLFVPQFLMAEANLGFLGLGITEPMPSMGNLLADLQNYSAIPEQPWRLVPVVILISILGCVHLCLGKERTTT